MREKGLNFQLQPIQGGRRKEPFILGVVDASFETNKRTGVTLARAYKS